MKTRAGHANPRGFSLVEVVVAIGIVSFGMLAVVGLLPTGLKIARNSAEQAQAANLVAALAESLRGATTTNGTNYVYSFAGQSLFYTNGSPPTTLVISNLTLEGRTNNEAGRLVAAVTITPPTTAATNGSAVISVAWPAVARPTWNSAAGTWDAKAEGAVTTAIQFLPRR
jgi:prepilin-type N-terminal cleavage/methylation domain-containing protein